MMKVKDYKTHGALGTVLVHLVIILLLLLFSLRTIPPEEEGMLVNFGDSETGLGAEEPMESVAEKREKTTPPPPTRKEPTASVKEKEAVNTQDFEEAAALKAEEKKKKEKAKVEDQKKKKEAIEAQKKIDEAERKKQEAIAAEKKKQDELNRQQAEAQNRVKNAMGGKGSGTSTASEGETQGTGNQGYVTGDPNSKNRTGSGVGTSGVGLSLAGRSVVGKLEKPEYNEQVEGIVVVEITVDQTGKVTNATPILKGSTTQNSYLWARAKEAALKTKINSDSNAAPSQKGTITYHFELN